MRAASRCEHTSCWKFISVDWPCSYGWQNFKQKNPKLNKHQLITEVIKTQSNDKFKVYWREYQLNNKVLKLALFDNFVLLWFYFSLTGMLTCSKWTGKTKNLDLSHCIIGLAYINYPSTLSIQDHDNLPTILEYN